LSSGEKLFLCYKNNLKDTDSNIHEKSLRNAKCFVVKNFAKLKLFWSEGTAESDQTPAAHKEIDFFY